jgi:hypothetical protein
MYMQERRDMVAIEVDFDVFKKLTVLRRSEDMTENQVIRELLQLSPPGGVSLPPKRTVGEGIGWACKGVVFPHGSEFRAVYKGQQFTAMVRNGALEFKGRRYKSPSAAAMAVTESPVNGWVFWECLVPGAAEWRTMASFRK